MTPRSLLRARRAAFNPLAVDPPSAYAPDCPECDAMMVDDGGDDWVCPDEGHCAHVIRRIPLGTGHTRFVPCYTRTHDRCDECGEHYCDEHLTDVDGRKLCAMCESGMGDEP